MNNQQQSPEISRNYPMESLSNIEGASVSDEHDAQSSCHDCSKSSVARPQHLKEKIRIKPRLSLSAYRRPAERLVDPDVSRKLCDFYGIQSRVIGQGGMSTVRLAVQRNTGLKVAVKIIEKHQIFRARRQSKNTKSRIDEWEILRMLKDNDHVVALLDVFETDDEVQLVFEYCEGGELFDSIQRRKSRQTTSPPHTEAEVANIASQILSVLEEMHSRSIVHRDVKPENILLARQGSLDTVKLCDFGIARRLPSDHIGDSPITGESSPLSPPPVRPRSLSVDGSDLYMAPEILKRDGYSVAADIYSLGVTLYVLLCGFPPSNHNTSETCLFPEHVSDNAKNLILKMLECDPSLRISASDAIQDSWLKSFVSKKRSRQSEASRTVCGNHASEEEDDVSSSRKRRREENPDESFISSVIQLYFQRVDAMEDPVEERDDASHGELETHPSSTLTAISA